MTERDRVFDAFRNCITEPKCKDCPWTECSTLDNGSVEIPRDLALAVMRELVAQEPRVMTLEEVRDLAGNHEIVWAENNGCKHCCEGYCSPDLYYRTKEVILWAPGIEDEYEPNNALYGKSWRCWTSRPTDTQREETAWES